MEMNIRTYDESIRERLLQSIKRIVTAECDAAGSPQPPEFELYDQYPLTDNDAAATERVTAALVKQLGQDRVKKLDPITASEDFSIIPNAFGIPYCYWGFGAYAEGSTVYPNHNPAFAPAIQPTLQTGTESAVAGILAYLGNEG